jgi:hypothetical protein
VNCTGGEEVEEVDDYTRMLDDAIEVHLASAAPPAQQSIATVLAAAGVAAGVCTGSGLTVHTPLGCILCEAWFFLLRGQF